MEITLNRVRKKSGKTFHHLIQSRLQPSKTANTEKVRAKAETSLLPSNRVRFVLLQVRKFGGDDMANQTANKRIGKIKTKAGS